MRVEVRLTPQKPDMASYTDNNNKNVKDITLIFTQANRLGAKPSDLVNGAAYGKCFKINAAFDVLVSPEAATATKPILLDLTNSPPGAAASPPARKPPGARLRAALLGDAFADYDCAVVGGRLAEAVECTWSKRLRTTSGITRMTKRRVGPVAVWERRAVVELSTHVCDSEEKMRHTLAHELCHAAAWVVDGVSKPPHGRAFKR